MKKFIALILTIALVVGCIPVTQAATNDYTILEVTEAAALKEDCYKDSVTADYVQPGDLLYCKARTINKYGNTWMEIICSNSESDDGLGSLYIYSSHVTEHVCEQEALEISDVTTVHMCRCGQYTVEGIHRTSAVALPQPDGILTPEEVAKLLGAIGALGNVVTGLASSVGAALPFLIPVTIFGITVYLGIQCDGRSYTVELDSVRYAPFDNDFDNGYYYPALVNATNKKVLFLKSNEFKMDLDEATAFISAAGKANDAMYQRFNKQTFLFGNTYTVKQDDAKSLCYKLAKEGFNFGGDKGPYTQPTTDKFKVPGNLYFNHYHLFYTQTFLQKYLFNHNNKLLIGSNDKVIGVHIFFDDPVQLVTA